ncbi:hypothetical protein L6452_32758 [Arctium lappa]|uniref:Uncharacterized protein n=1 Tax=Arctium lappa TaxID=4217 RepID=A0ACB8Z5W6_ARCLA|nr:hypothetical protein L6452_32758 [Arctium lappa]
MRHKQGIKFEIMEVHSLCWLTLLPFDQISINSSLRSCGSDLLPWEAVLECYIWSDHFLHFCQKCRAQIGRFPSERKSYTL